MFRWPFCCCWGYDIITSPRLVLPSSVVLMAAVLNTNFTRKLLPLFQRIFGWNFAQLLITIISLRLCKKIKSDFSSENHYKTFIVSFLTAITYRVVIITGKQLGGSTTTANVWMILAGEIKDTGTISVPKNECEFRFQVRVLKGGQLCGIYMTWALNIYWNGRSKVTYVYNL